MKSIKYILPILILLLAGGCITRFVPEINESRETLVVEGMITDQPGKNIIRLSKSVPLASYGSVDPYRYCTVTIADDDAEAIALANNTNYGLGVSLFTADTAKALELSREFDDGAVFINGLVKSDPRLPFGGTKRSGYGRELSVQGIREFVNVKTVWCRG